MLVTRKQWSYISLIKPKPGTFVFDIHCGPFYFEDQCLLTSFQLFLPFTGYDIHAGITNTDKIYRLTKDRDEAQVSAQGTCQEINLNNKILSYVSVSKKENCWLLIIIILIIRIPPTPKIIYLRIYCTHIKDIFTSFCITYFFDEISLFLFSAERVVNTKRIVFTIFVALLKRN